MCKLKRKVWILVVLAVLLCVRGALAEGTTSLTAINVGKGDALLLSVGEENYLIDTGRNWAWGRLQSALTQLGIAHLDGVILTHTDEDHAGSMELLAQTDISVDAWYAAAQYASPKKAEKHPLVKAVGIRGQQVVWLNAGDEIACAGGTMRVLAPFAVDPDNENNNSLVLHVETADGTLLLTGDMELAEEQQLLQSGVDLAADVLKVAHHGEDDATSVALARAVKPQVAVICTDSYEEPDTPDAKVLAVLESVGADTYVTQDAGMAVRIALTDGQASVELLDFADRIQSADVALAKVVANPDEIVLENRSGAAVDIGGWYLYVDRDEELLLFPQGTMIESGAQLRVSTGESEFTGDVVWDSKNVISNKKEDAVYLYDAYGSCVDSVTVY